MFHAIYLSLIEEGTALGKYTFLLFFTENSFMKEEKLMKFLTDSCRMPILGVEVNSLKYRGKFQTRLCKWMQMFSHGLDMFFYIRVTSPYPGSEEILSVLSTALVAGVSVGRC